MDTTRSKIRGAFRWHDPEKIISQRVFNEFYSSFLQSEGIELYFQKNITSSTPFELDRSIFYQTGQKMAQNYHFGVWFFPGCLMKSPPICKPQQYFMNKWYIHLAYVSDWWKIIKQQVRECLPSHKLTILTKVRSMIFWPFFEILHNFRLWTTKKCY